MSKIQNTRIVIPTKGHRLVDFKQTRMFYCLMRDIPYYDRERDKDGFTMQSQGNGELSEGSIQDGDTNQQEVFAGSSDGKGMEDGSGTIRTTGKGLCCNVSRDTSQVTKRHAIGSDLSVFGRQNIFNFNLGDSEMGKDNNSSKCAAAPVVPVASVVATVAPKATKTQKRLTLAQLYQVKKAVELSKGQAGLATHIATALGISVSSARKTITNIDARIAGFGKNLFGRKGMPAASFKTIWDQANQTASVTGHAGVTS